jgi:WD40 repeat protein
MSPKENTEMDLTKNQKNRMLHLIVPAFIICLTLPSFASAFLTVGQIEQNYTYYGVVPEKIYRYILNDWNAGASSAWTDLSSGWSIGTSEANLLGGSLALNGLQVATKALLAIVATEDDTDVEVYDLTNGSLLDEGHINNMEKHLVLLANGTQFKVVSNKIVSVLLLNYQEIPSATATDGPIPRTFYTDVNGLYVGKKFVLMASEQQGAVSGASSSQVGAFYAVLALEKASVTVTKDDGTVYTTFSLEANSYKFILLDSFKVYTIESSTGNIMVQSGTITGKGSADSPCFAVPSAQGGFVGTAFYTRSLKNQEWSWDPGRDYGFRITAAEDTSVKVYDLETSQLIKDLTVSGGSGTAIQTESFAIAVLSDKPITLTELHNGSIVQSPTGGGGTYAGYGNGVMFITIQPAEDTMIHLPTDAHIEAYFFASEATQLTIDGNTQTIQANTGFLYTVLGTHTVSADHNVVLQVNFWPLEPEYQGIWFSGAAIPCIETVNDNPTVTLTPIEGFPMMYVIVGIAVAAVAVIVGIFVMRRRGK